MAVTASGIGPWTLGKDLISITLASVTVTTTTTGALSGTTWTVGTPTDCVGFVRRLNHQFRYALKDIRPITQVQENNVPISTGNALQITNLRLSNNTTPGNWLAALIGGTAGVTPASPYVQAIFQDSHEVFNGFYVIASYESGFDGMEEQIQTMDLQPVAITSTGGQVVRSFLP